MARKSVGRFFQIIECRRPRPISQNKLCRPPRTFFWGEHAISHRSLHTPPPFFDFIMFR